MSPLEKKRLRYAPKIPQLLRNLEEYSTAEQKGGAEPSAAMQKLFPLTWKTPSYQIVKQKSGPSRQLRVGAYFSGGPASGGHNVLAGLFDSLHPEFIGFLNGPSGLIENQWRKLDKLAIDSVRNQGGFDLIGTSRTKFESEEQFQAALKTVVEHKLDALVVIGGDDSNTNAAMLAEYFLKHDVKTSVIGVPKTIDGDLRSDEIEISFGFDSACKTYAELIGNIARDAKSAGKYYHFIKLMGRSASHITLECALKTHPNLALIGEEGKNLTAIISEVADLVEKRFAHGKEYGVILLPEGLIEFIPEIKKLIKELNSLLAQDPGAVETRLSPEPLATFKQLPEKIQKQLLLDRDPHGNVQVSKIETDQLLIELVKKELKKRSFRGKFSVQGHFLGYEGRCCLPTNFDANYGYALGAATALAIRNRLTGVISAISNLKSPPEEWVISYIPIVRLMRMETRKGKEKPVIEKALVDLNGASYVKYKSLKNFWEFEDAYQSPGPIQFYGDPELTDEPPEIVLDR